MRRSSAAILAEMSCDNASDEVTAGNCGDIGFCATVKRTFPFQVRRHALNLSFAEEMQFLQKAIQHEPAAQIIDHARDAVGLLVNRLKGFRIEKGISFPPDAAQSMLHIGAAFRWIERSQMIRGNNSLAELLHVRVRQERAKLWLTNQKTLKWRRCSNLKIGKHPQFFQRVD
jgi:hypothetical protein